MSPISVGSHMRDVATKSCPVVCVFSSGDEVDRLGPLGDDMPSFDSLVQAFLSLAEARMTDTQKTVLVHSAELLDGAPMTLTGLADVLSKKASLPYSTVKWNLKSLRSMGLLVGGDSKNRGRLAWLTPPALMLARHLQRITWKT